MYCAFEIYIKKLFVFLHWIYILHVVFYFVFLQTVGVDEASLLETTVAFFRSFPDSDTTLDTTRRGGRSSGKIARLQQNLTPTFFLVELGALKTGTKTSQWQISQPNSSATIMTISLYRNIDKLKSILINSQRRARPIRVLHWQVFVIFSFNGKPMNNRCIWGHIHCIVKAKAWSCEKC